MRTSTISIIAIVISIASFIIIVIKSKFQSQRILIKAHSIVALFRVE